VPIWEEAEGAPRQLNKLRLSVMGTDEECFIDAMGRSHCTHNHPHAAKPLQEVYEEVEGWTAQGWTPKDPGVQITTVRPMRLEDASFELQKHYDTTWR
jgi:hypothetical protein